MTAKTWCPFGFTLVATRASPYQIGAVRNHQSGLKRMKGSTVAAPTAMAEGIGRPRNLACRESPRMTALFSIGLVSPQLKDERRLATMAGPAKTRKAPTTTSATQAHEMRLKAARNPVTTKAMPKKAVASVPRNDASTPVATVSALVKTTCARAGSELGEDAVIDRHHLDDVGLGLGVGWHAVVFAHGLGAGVVSGKSKLQAAKGGHLFEKITRAAVKVFDGVGRIDVEVISRARHQLCEAKGTCIADSPLRVIALDLDHRLEEGGPFGRRKLEPRQGRMILIAGGNQPDLWQDIPWGSNVLGAVGHISGGLSPPHFPGPFFNSFRAERYNQLPLRIIAQDG